VNYKDKPLQYDSNDPSITKSLNQETMKKRTKYLQFSFLLLIIFSISLNAQVEERKKSLVTKNDGTEYVGVILQQDAREILLQTESVGELIIPKHEIKSIEEFTGDKYTSAKYAESNIFATRYFFSNNGLPMSKGESYAMIQLAGAEYQVAVVDNLTIGGLTSWIGVPIVASAKYAIRVTDNFNLAVGALAGTGSWAAWGTYGVMPYGSVTVGNPRINLNLSVGYLSIGNDGSSTASAPLYSIGGLARLSDRVSFVGDSFIYAQESNVVAIVIPGLRFDRNKGGAFQFGLAGLVVNNKAIPFPVPFLSWFIDI
jgi:hypothetical protein